MICLELCVGRNKLDVSFGKTRIQLEIEPWVDFQLDDSLSLRNCWQRAMIFLAVLRHLKYRTELNVANAVSWTGSQALLRPPLAPTSDPIFLDHAMCNGSESYLTNCTHRGIGIHDCSHFEDAGVACLGESMIMKLTCRNILRLSCIH